MALALVQANEGVSALATTTASFSIAPTSGNLVVLAFASDDYNGTPNTGWTQSAEMEQQTFHGGYIWWRISDGSNSLQYTIGSATVSAWVLAEFSGHDATPYDISEGTFIQSSDLTMTTANITPTTGERLLVAMIGGSSTANLSADSISYNNSFTHINSIGTSAGATNDIVGLAYRLVTGNGSTTFNTTGTYSGGAVQARTALVISFKEAGAPAAPALTYFGSAATPAGLNAAATGVADPTAVTPPGSMLAGDLVCMIGHQRATGAVLAVSATGGQTWNTLTAIGTTTVTARVFWCVFNGTWGANPSVDFDAVLCNSVQMHVFRPPAPGSTWAVNQAQVELDIAAGTGVHTVTGQTTTGTNPTVTLAGWFTADDNQWSTTSGTGWVTTGDEWYLNTSGTDHSSTYTHKIQTAAGATGNVSRTQSALGPDASTTFIVTFEAIAPPRRRPTVFSYAVNRAALH